MSTHLFKSQIIYVDPDKLKDNPFQKDYFDIEYHDPNKQKEFEDSVRKYGVKTPVKITIDYVIIGGHNRKYTSKKFNKKVPCLMATKTFSLDELELHTLEDNYFDKDMTRPQRDKAWNRLYLLVRNKYESHVDYSPVYVDGLAKTIQSIENFTEKGGLVLSAKEQSKLNEIKKRKLPNFGKDVDSKPDEVKEILIDEIGIDKDIADKVIKNQKRINTQMKREKGQNDSDYYLAKIEELIYYHSKDFCSNLWTYYQYMNKSDQNKAKKKIIKLLGDLSK